MPTASLPTLEQRLEACLLELERLHLTRPGLPTAMARAEAGQRIDDLLDEIAELQRLIDTSPAETLEDAAVKPRRLEMEMISPAGSRPAHISRRGAGPILPRQLERSRSPGTRRRCRDHLFC